MKSFRIVRILEYIGTREFIDSCIERRAVRGQINIKNQGTIREVILHEYPEIVEEEDRGDSQ